ncbi:MAG TPA: (d)CMP kinase, partial [Steroidobacteraceae bacterium]|nr:(d)CMP kinase [Steroidobacteraceae bacterium]
RLVALAGQRHGLAPDDEPGHAHLATRLDVEFGVGPKGGERILLGGEEVADVIRTERCGDMASQVAVMQQVRDALVARQRAFAVPPGLVADGRDMGTVIFPAAPLKIFLTASPEERAQRRYKQLKEKGIDVNLRALSLEIAERDRRDANRTIAPLRPADDAVILDSTAMTIDEVVARVLELAAERLPANR